MTKIIVFFVVLATISLAAGVSVTGHLFNKEHKSSFVAYTLSDKEVRAGIALCGKREPIFEGNSLYCYEKK